MTTEQIHPGEQAARRGPLADQTLESLLNLLELSNSELTAFTGSETLPVTELLRDSLVDLLAVKRPDLFAHSQRVAWLAYGIGRQLGWSPRRIQTLMIAGLLHELGSLTDAAPHPFWEFVGTEREEVESNATVDLLKVCHSESDLLEMISLGHNFAYRQNQPEETPPHVIEGAAAFTFAHLFDTARFIPDANRELPEILAALKSLAESPLEQKVVAGLEEWLNGGDPLAATFDVNLLRPHGTIGDPETAQIVRDTFSDILQTLADLQRSYDAFFLLDATGKFQLWNSGCVKTLGRTVREMRNKYWTNQLMGYCNDEGLAFSDSQTPLYQTLETGKPSETTLCIQDRNENIFEVHIDAVPLLGRDRLLQGIIELQRKTKPGDATSEEPLITPEWVNELAEELGRLATEEGDEESALPRVLTEQVENLEQQLGIVGLLAPPEVQEAEHEEIVAEQAVSAPPVLESATTEEEPEAVDALSETTESEPSAVEFDRETPIDEARRTEEASAAQAPADSEDNLDDLFSRFDQLVTDVDDDLDEPTTETNESAEIAESADNDETTLAAQQVSQHHAQQFTLPPQEPVEETAEVDADNSLESEQPSEPQVVEVEDLEDNIIDEEQVEEVSESEADQLSVEDAHAEEIASAPEADSEPIFDLDEDLSDAEQSESDAVEPGDVPAANLHQAHQFALPPLDAVQESDQETVADELVTSEDSPAEESSESNSVTEVAAEIEEVAAEASPESEPTADLAITNPAVDHEADTESFLLPSTEPVSEDSPSDEIAAQDTQPAAEPAATTEDEHNEEPIKATAAPFANTPPDTVAHFILPPREEEPAAAPTKPKPDPGQTDPRVQPITRSEWDSFVTHLIDENSRDREMVSVLFLDIDRFKTINEGFGIKIGSDLISEIARRLSAACGKRELSCRYGGEQFAIVCPGLSLKQGYKRAEQFRKLIEKTRFDVLPFQKITASIGVTASEKGDSLDDLMNRAEHAMYRAKRHGRNCCIGIDSAEIDNDTEESRPQKAQSSSPFEIATTFEAMVAADMITYKLGGFLYDMHARLLQVDRRHVKMRVGNKGLLPYWGRKDESRPVLIELELGENWEQAKSAKGNLARTTIHVRLTPDGWVNDEATFQRRASQVLRALKGYFVA